MTFTNNFTKDFESSEKDEVSLATLWDISALSLYTPNYTERYVGYLCNIIQDPNSKILDSSCGSGFPAIELAMRGYLNITASDADDCALKLIKSRAEDASVSLQFIQSRWQSLSESTDQRFDFLLNTGNSLPYFASWNIGDGSFMSEDKMFTELKEVLKQFYKILKPEGRAIIALTSTQTVGITHKVIDFDEIEYGGIKAQARWDLTYDWSKRVKYWKVNTRIRSKNYDTQLFSYLFTKEELVGLLQDVGFRVIQIVQDDLMYDDLIVAEKC